MCSIVVYCVTDVDAACEETGLGEEDEEEDVAAVPVDIKQGPEGNFLLL